MITPYFWLAVGAITVFLEIGHPGLFLFLAIGIGAFGAAGLAACEYSIAEQLTGFTGITLISCILLRCFIRLQNTGYQSSVHTLSGSQGTVTKRITHNHGGHVRINSEEWLARSVDGTPIEVGALVTVVRVERTTVLVTHTVNPRI